jgi:hypothetical protein
VRNPTRQRRYPSTRFWQRDYMTPREPKVPDLPDEYIADPHDSPTLEIDIDEIRSQFPLFITLDLHRCSINQFLSKKWKTPDAKKRWQRLEPWLYKETWIAKCLKGLDNSGGARIRLLQLDIDRSLKNPNS